MANNLSSNDMLCVSNLDFGTKYTFPQFQGNTNTPFNYVIYFN